MNRVFLNSTVAAAALMVSGGVALAQSSDAPIVQAPPTNIAQPLSQRAFPSGFGVPSAVAPTAGSGFVGATFVTPRGGVSGADNDGSVAAGYSIGNPVDGVSLTFGLAITGIDPFGDSGSFSVSASRLLGIGENSATFLGASAAGLLGWGDADDAETYNIYLSHVVGIPTGTGELPMQFSVGFGTDAITETNGTGNRDDGFYAGVGVGLTSNLSAGLSITETQANLGFTVTIPDAPVSITAGFTDITDETDRQQFSLSVGFGF